MADAKQQPVLKKPPGFIDPNAKPPSRPRPVLPPRNASLPPPAYKPRKKWSRRSCCFTCCCCFCILSLILLLLLLIFGVVFFFWFNPKLPTFHIQSFRLTTFNITANLDENYLTAQTVTRIEVKNPNERITFYYGATSVDVKVGQDADETDLGIANLGEFTQQKENITSLKIETKVENQPVDSETGNRLMNRLKSKELKTSVDVQTKFGVGMGTAKVGMLGVRVNCGGTMKELDGSSSIMPKCTITVLRWINMRA